MGDRIFITRRGCQLGNLEEHDVVETGLSKNDRATPMASIELPTHRAIYKATQANAIIHAHPLHAIALSLSKKKIQPNCVEGEFLGLIPVLGWGTEVKAGGLTDIIAEALKQHHIVVVKGHGTFATGQLLEEALHYTSGFEANCRVLCLMKSMNSRG